MSKPNLPKTAVPLSKPTTQPKPVPVVTRIADNIYKRLNKYKRDKGFSADQDVIRLAISQFLDRERY